MTEQPPEHDDLVDHAKLRKELIICLDESITGTSARAGAISSGISSPPRSSKEASIH